jgi:hypothetical protein
MVLYRQHAKRLIGVLIVSLAMVSISDFAVAGVKDTAVEEATCKDIGFRPKTASFADCVLELLSRKEAKANDLASRSKGGVMSSSVVQGVAATSNRQSCIDYGFKVSTAEFGQCLMQLDETQRQAQIQQQQYELQLAQYQQQVAAYNAQQEEIKRERNRRQGEALLRMSQGMLNSSSPTLLGGMADGFSAVNGGPVTQPVAPLPPPNQNYTIRLPNGIQVYCNYNAIGSYLSCR